MASRSTPTRRRRKPAARRGAAKARRKLRQVPMPGFIRRSRWKRWSYIAAYVALAAAVTLGGWVVLVYGMRASLIDLKIVQEVPKASVVYDAHGNELGRFFDQNRILLPEGPLPKYLSEAVVATEDQRFWTHPGVDPAGIVRAALANLIPGGSRQGGSTITQQLARNSIGMMQRTYDRKLLEIFLALRVERTYSKEEILRHYLDWIYYGHGLYGAETASEAYFGKPAADLSLGEAALLAGLISGPNSFSPWGSASDSKEARQTRHERAMDARDRALGRMLRHGFITQEQYDEAEAQPITLRPRPSFAGTYAMEEIRQVLAKHMPREELLRGGLKIYSTVDKGMQGLAENVVADQIAQFEGRGNFPKANRGKLQAAFFALDTNSGAILAVVGGRNYQETQYNRAIQARRQAGSTLKPLIYATAFTDHGYSPASWVQNTKFNLKKPDGWRHPTGPESWVRVNEALVKSDNYAAVRMGNRIGPEAFVYYAQQAGITSGIPPYPSSYLGACDVSLADLVQVYATFASGGTWRRPYIIREVRTDEDKVLFTYKPFTREVWTPQVAFQVTGMLENVVDHGTGRGARSRFGMKMPLAGKTGTTNDYKDAWFIGYSSSIVAGAWVGLDQPTRIMPGGYGSTLALPIWARVMNAAGEHYRMGAFPEPPGLERVSLGNNQVVYLRPDQVWQAKTSPGETSSGEQPKSWWQRLWPW